MDFQMQLLQLQEALGKADVQALAFLCTDLLSKDLSDISSVTELVSLLQTQDLLSPHETSLLTELLHILKRQSLARQLALPSRLPEPRLISSYREMLFVLSENVTIDDLRDIKFLLRDTLPRRKLEESTTMLKLLMEMEKEDLLSSSNLETLEKVVKRVCPSLGGKISRYRQLMEPPRVQEAGVSEKRPEIEEGLLTSQISSLSLGTFDSTDARPAIPMSQSLTSSSDTEEMVYGSEEQLFGASVTSSYNEAVNLEAYVMNRMKRGFCLIINNYNFSSSRINLKNREGTQRDTTNLEAVFQWLGFETHVKQDFSRQQMLSFLQNFGRKDHTDMDCFVCCVLSHGVPGGVYGVDGAEVRLSELLEPFSAHCCTSLQQKPKMFFIQACQGTQEQKAVFLQSDSPHDMTSDTGVLPDSFPTDADFLLGMATVPDFVSFRDKKQGTWYIRSLCQNLLVLVPRGIDLLSILTEVNNDVSKRTDIKGTKKQMPQPAYTLRKKVIFPKPKALPPILN